MLTMTFLLSLQISKSLFVPTENTAARLNHMSILPAQVLPMFNDTSADVVIRTTDNVHLRTHKLILKMTIPVFETMFTLPQLPPSPASACTESPAPESPHIIDVSERSPAMQRFLQFCYPINDPNLDSLEEIQEMLEVITKYDTEEIKGRVRTLLVDPKFLRNSPLRVFSIAYRYKLEYEVRAAAKWLLQEPLSTIYVLELESIPASAYHRYQDYYLRCRTAAAQSFSSSNLTWVPSEEPGGLEFLSSPSPIWFACRQCAAAPKFNASNGREVQPTKWWSEYMETISSALADIPSFSTKAIVTATDKALETATECAGCRGKVIPQLRAFNSLVSVQIEKVISAVSIK